MTKSLRTNGYQPLASVPVIRAVVIIIGILIVGVGVVRVPYTPA